MPIKNIGVLAFASAAVAAGHNHYQHNHLHARGTGSGAAPAMPTGLPACWGSCFQKSAVSSPDALCDNSDVSNCIKIACATEDVAKYEGWLEKQCNSGAPYPAGHNSTAVGPTATGGYSSAPGGYSTSICTETSTLLYQTTTEYSTYLVTHTLSASAPGGGYGSGSSDVSVSPATESAAAPGGYGSGSGAPSGGAGGYLSGGAGSPTGGAGGEECSDVTVTTTERTTVTVTAGEGGAPSSYAAPSSPAPEAPSSYAAPSSEGSGSQPTSYVSEAGGAPSSYAAPSPYESPSSAAPAPSSYGGASSSSAPSSSPSSPSGGGSSNGWKGKRGLAYNRTSDVIDSLFEGAHIGWATTWEASSFDYIPSDFPFIPTLHSADPMFTSVFHQDVEIALGNGAEYIFGQNEPDMASQANQSPKDAADTWREFMEPYAGRAKLCAPSVTNSPPGSGMGLDWLDEFMKECADCTIDCVNQHWYDSRGNDASVFKDQVNKAAGYGKPVFVGEFAGIGSQEEISGFLGEIMPWMDGNDAVVGYAYFMVYNGLLVDNGAVSSYGETYCNGS